MSNIISVQQKIFEFLTKEQGKEKSAIRVIKIEQSKEGWEGKVEITEINEYMKKMGHPMIFDKNVYTVRLDQALDIIAFAQTESRERSYLTEEVEDI
jgi:hypothetical protein